MKKKTVFFAPSCRVIIVVVVVVVVVVDIDKYAQINGDIVALVVQAEQMMQNDDLDADRQPDVVGSWEETLPHRLLNRLSKPRGKRARG